MTYHGWAAVLLQSALMGVLAAQVEPRADKNVYKIDSELQLAANQLRVLVPDRMVKGKRYRTLYVLPVEAGEEHRFGDGFRTIKAANLHNQHDLICVFPSFTELPWYVDHPTNSRRRQESYFTEVVVPFIDRGYPTVATAQGRLLVGFSKSGWGAFSLLLRHPDSFGIAGAWDAPLNQARPDRFGMQGPFGTQANFEKYRITTLLRTRASLLSERRRLVLTGYGGFRKHHQVVHAEMQKLQIRHLYRDGPKRKHVWNSGWLPELVGLMLRPVTNIGGLDVPVILRRLGAKGVEGEARQIFQRLDSNGDGKLTEPEFHAAAGFEDARFAAAVHRGFDTDADKSVALPEFLLVWAKWAGVE